MTGQTIETIFKSEGVDDILEDLHGMVDGMVGEMPPADEQVVNNIQGAAPTIKSTINAKAGDAPASEIKDSAGAVFNPEIHAVKNGKPSTRKDGRFKFKQGGASLKQRKKFGQPSAPGKPKPAAPQPSIVATDAAPAPGPVSQGLPPASDQKIAASASVAASMLVMCGKMIGGEEWEPRVGKLKIPQGNDFHIVEVNERENLEQCFAEYFQRTGVVDLPPGLALTMGICAYALPRFSQPQTKSWWGRFKDKLKIRFLKKRVESNGAQPHHRQDRERENDSREGPGPTVS